MTFQFYLLSELILIESFGIACMFLDVESTTACLLFLLHYVELHCLVNLSEKHASFRLTKTTFLWFFTVTSSFINPVKPDTSKKHLKNPIQTEAFIKPLIKIPPKVFPISFWIFFSVSHLINLAFLANFCSQQCEQILDTKTNFDLK